MYNLEIKDNKEYFEKDIVKYLYEHKNMVLQYIRYNKYVKMFKYTNNIDLLYSELMDMFLFKYKDYDSEYQSDHITSLSMYVKYLIKLGLQSYILKEQERNKYLVPLEQVTEHGGKDYLNCKEYGVDLYNKYVGISVDVNILRASIKDLYIRGLKQGKDYMLIVYMLYHTDITSLLDYYALQGKTVTMSSMRDTLNKNTEIIEILSGLEKVGDNSILNIIRDRVKDIELVDKFIGVTQSI